VISTDPTYTGAGTVTPLAVGLCATGRAAWTAAPGTGTGLPASGSVMPFRPGGYIATVGTTTGASYDAVRPSVRPKALEELALVGVTTTHTSSTPGDLPPEDPLS